MLVFAFLVFCIFPTSVQTLTNDLPAYLDYYNEEDGPSLYADYDEEDGLLEDLYDYLESNTSSLIHLAPNDRVDADKFYCVSVYNDSQYKAYEMNNNKDDFVLAEKITDILSMKNYLMGVWGKTSFPEQLCLWSASDSLYESTEYKEVFVPWEYGKRWVKKNEFVDVVDNSSYPCVCTINDNIQYWDWIVRDEDREIIWSALKETVLNVTGSNVSCMFYDPLKTFNNYYQHGVYVYGYYDPDTEKFEKPGFVEGMIGFGLNYTRCYYPNDTSNINYSDLVSKDVVLLNPDYKRTTTTTIEPTTTTTEPVYKLSRCFCIHESVEIEDGYLVGEKYCAFEYKGYRNLLSDSILYEFLRQPYKCDATKNYNLNDSHVIHCKIGYRFSVLEKKYISSLGAAAIDDSFSYCELYLLVEDQTSSSEDVFPLYDVSLEVFELSDSFQVENKTRITTLRDNNLDSSINKNEVNKANINRFSIIVTILIIYVSHFY